MKSIEQIKNEHPVRRGVRGVSAQMAALENALHAAGYEDYGRTTQVRGLKLAVLQHFAGTATTEKNSGSMKFAASYWEHWFAQKDEYDAAMRSLPPSALALKIDGEPCIVTRINTSSLRGLRGRKAFRVYRWDGDVWQFARYYITARKSTVPRVTARNVRQMIRRALGLHHRIQRKRYDVRANSLSDFHESVMFAAQIIERATGEAYHCYAVANPKSARRECAQAMHAFAQRRIEKVNEEQIRDLAPRTFVAISDSIRAGNCESMTAQFAREMWADLGAGSCAVRADLLLAKRDDIYTKRAVQAAIIRS